MHRDLNMHSFLFHPFLSLLSLLHILFFKSTYHLHSVIYEEGLNLIGFDLTVLLRYIEML